MLTGRNKTLKIRTYDKLNINGLLIKTSYNKTLKISSESLEINLRNSYFCRKIIRSPKKKKKKSLLVIGLRNSYFHSVLQKKGLHLKWRLISSESRSESVFSTNSGSVKVHDYLNYSV